MEKQGTHESGGDCQTQSEDREMGWRRCLGARTVYSKPAYFKNIYVTGGVLFKDYSEEGDSSIFV